MFFEDLYAINGPIPVPPTIARRKPSRPNPRRAETLGAREQSEPCSDRLSPSKRNSIFGRRPKSDASRTSSSFSSQRSSVTEMPSDGEGLKTRFLRRKPKPPPKNEYPSERDGDFAREGNLQRHRRGASDGSTDHSWISRPFGFQHIAKIERSETKKEYFVDQVAMRPPPPNVHPPPEELQSSLARRDGRPQKRPPPLRPKRPDEITPEDMLSPPWTAQPTLRQIRSAETFTQSRMLWTPASAPPTAPSQSGPPYGFPPQNLHPVPHAEQFDQPQVSVQSSHKELTLSGEWDRLLPLYDQRPGYTSHELGGFGHTYTTHDSTAISAMSPLFSPPLEQVPEEPEGTSPRESKDVSQLLTSNVIRHAKSTPSLKTTISNSKEEKTKSEELVRGGAAPPLIRSRPASQGSDTLGDISRRSFAIKETQKKAKKNEEGRTTGGSWEDDIDYCYNHAAEAHCDFDWSNSSQLLDADTSDEESGPEPVPEPTLKHQQSDSTDSTSGSDADNSKALGRSFYHQSIIPNRDSIPELDYRSAHTASSNSLAAVTPKDNNFRFASDGQRQSGEIPIGTTLVSPQLPSFDFRTNMSSDYLYHEVLAGINKPDEQPLPFLEPKTFNAPNAAKTRMSKRASTEKTLKKRPPPPPTSVPIMAPPLSPPPPTPPPKSPPFTKTATPPPLPAIPSPSLSVDCIIAQLRSSPTTESPVEPEPQTFPLSPTTPSFKPRSQFNLAAPRPRSRKGPDPASIPSPNPLAKLRDLTPSNLTRNDSADTVVTIVAIAPPPSPPESPDDEMASPGNIHSSSTQPARGLNIEGISTSNLPPPPRRFSSKSPPPPPPPPKASFLSHSSPMPSPRLPLVYLPPPPRESSYQQEQHPRSPAPQSQFHKKTASDTSAFSGTPPVSPVSSGSGRGSYSLFPSPGGSVPGMPGMGNGGPGMGRVRTQRSMTAN